MTLWQTEITLYNFTILYVSIRIYKRGDYFICLGFCKVPNYRLLTKELSHSFILSVTQNITTACAAYKGKKG